MKKHLLFTLALTCLFSLSALAQYSPIVENNIRMWKESVWASREYLDTLQVWQQRGDTATINDAFGSVIEFGTAGLRGPMGPGTNRLNEFTVARATQGLANYLYKAAGEGAMPKQLTVVIGYDCRHNSQVFAKVAADVLTANQINVCMFDEMRPTPEISFATRYLHAAAAINITASHNAKEDNGYKAYWADGGQIVPPHDAGIMDEVKKITSAGQITYQLVEEMDYGWRYSKTQEIDNAYILMAQTALLDADAAHKAKDLKIVYTPLHGVGYYIVPRCLKEMGINHVSIVEAQKPDNGLFRSVQKTKSKQANPEDEEAMELLLQQTKAENADLAVATDPDADRFGFYCKDSEGEWHRIDGHQSTMLFTRYIINTRQRLGLMPDKPYMGRTVVTSEIVKRIANEAHIKMYDEYTGFKWIAHRIDALSQVAPDSTFIGAGEESFCYLPYDKVRDKDAPASICLLAEMAAEAQSRGTTLWDDLMQIYRHHGFQREYTLKWRIDAENKRPWRENKDNIMQLFRDNIRSIHGDAIREFYDFSKLDKALQRGLPQTDNVLQYFTQSGIKLTIRPSGTEPVLKVYLEIPSDLFTSPERYQQAVQETDVVKLQIEDQLKKLLKDNKYTVL